MPVVPKGGSRYTPITMLTPGEAPSGTVKMSAALPSKVHLAGRQHHRVHHHLVPKEPAGGLTGRGPPAAADYDDHAGGHLRPAAGGDFARDWFGFAEAVCDCHRGGLVVALIMGTFLLPTFYVWWARPTDHLPGAEESTSVCD